MRDYNSKHPDGAPLNADANQRYPNFFDRMPEITKEAVIKDLKVKNNVLETLVKDYRERLLKTIGENIKLKSRFNLDAETEKSQYNSLLQEIESENSNEKSEGNDSDSGNSDKNLGKKLNQLRAVKKKVLVKVIGIATILMTTANEKIH